jgi:hypothetical protein
MAIFQWRIYFNITKKKIQLLSMAKCYPAYKADSLSIDIKTGGACERKEDNLVYLSGPLLPRGRGIFNWNATEFLSNLAEMESVDGKTDGQGKRARTSQQG